MVPGGLPDPRWGSELESGVGKQLGDPGGLCVPGLCSQGYGWGRGDRLVATEVLRVPDLQWESMSGGRRVAW